MNCTSYEATLRPLMRFTRTRVKELYKACNPRGFGPGSKTLLRTAIFVVMNELEHTPRHSKSEVRTLRAVMNALNDDIGCNERPGPVDDFAREVYKRIASKTKRRGRDMTDVRRLTY